MATVQEILDRKGHEIIAIGPDATVFDALRLMDEKDVGAVLVMEGDELIGMFTERHYARKVFLKGKSSPNTRVRDVMSSQVAVVAPDQSAEYCMALMSEKKIRHLPVLNDGTLIGVVSIGDLMKSIIAGREFEVDQLIRYVSGERA